MNIPDLLNSPEGKTLEFKRDLSLLMPVLETFREGGYPAPEWQELGAVLRAIFPPHPEVVRQLGTNVPTDEHGNEHGNEHRSEHINQRQRWFLGQLGDGRQANLVSIVDHWNVSKATAMRDVARLREQGLIEYVGARKKGHYRLTQPDARSHQP